MLKWLTILLITGIYHYYIIFDCGYISDNKTGEWCGKAVTDIQDLKEKSEAFGDYVIMKDLMIPIWVNRDYVE